eukprot:236108_1
MSAFLVLLLALSVSAPTKGSSCSNASSLEVMQPNTLPYSICNSDESPQCSSSSSYYSCLPLDMDLCGCSEPSILSNIIVLIDGTNHSNDYSWYYWSTSFPKIWFYDIMRYQPLINVTFIYYGTEVRYTKRGDPAHFFGADWSIPAIFIDDETPNLCNAFDAAIDIFQKQQDDTKKILILLANTTPFIPNRNDVCATNLSLLHNVDTYAMKTSPHVNLSVLEEEPYIQFDSCVNVMDAYDPSWATYFDEESYSYRPNLNVYNYLNAMVSTVSDFVCLHSDICQYIHYATASSNHTCSFSCVEEDYSCVFDTSFEAYYMVSVYDGTHPKLLTQNESNRICKQYFNTSLASIGAHTGDAAKIVSLMEMYNVSECWIGLNRVAPIFGMQNVSYFEWMDGSINAIDYAAAMSDDGNGCVSMVSTGEWIRYDCHEAHTSCFICNTVDTLQTLTVSNDKYHVIHSLQSKTQEEANHYCMKHYDTHLSTIQSAIDQNDMMNVLQSMQLILSRADNESISIANVTSDTWIGDTVLISYDGCIDYTLDEIWADGSSYPFTLLNYNHILDETCSPTLSPTSHPSMTITSATINTTGIDYQAPISPTPQPTNTPTLSPTFQLTKPCAVSSQDASQWHTRLNNDSLHLFSCNVLDRTQYVIESERYYVFYGNISKTWIESDAYCSSIFGTKLSTIYETSDQHEIITLRNQITNDSKERNYDMWIGLKLDDASFSESQIEWTDGSKSNYSRLNSGCLAILENDAWIMHSCADIAYTWSCNHFVPTYRPTVSPTIHPIAAVEEETYLHRILGWIRSHPFETFYILLVSMSCVVAILAFFHSKNILCCCCDAYYADDAKWTTVVVYAVQIWDFLSDCSFAYNIQLFDSFSILFILSSSFILVPWICNICFLFIFRYQHSIATNFETNQWFRNHSYKLVLLTMLCGSANASINLMNSRIFGAHMFNMGLTKLQLIQTTKFKVLLNTLTENLPQIVFTSYFMIITDDITNFAVMSLISSTLSVILVIVVTIIFSIDPMQDEYIQMTLKYNEPLEETSPTNIETDLLKRFGFHLKIAQSIAYSFGLNKKLVTVDKHKYNVKRKSVTLLVSINTAQNNHAKEDTQSAAHVDSSSITDHLIHAMDTKHATLMVIKVLESIKCSAYSRLFYQMNLIPLNKNGQKKLPISKKIKLDPNLMSSDFDFTVFDETEQIVSSLLRAGSDPMRMHSLNPDMNRRITPRHNDSDEDELMIRALPPRPISIDADDDNKSQQIEMMKQLSTPL